MTAFVNDSIQKQIARGEIFFVSTAWLVVPRTTIQYIGIETGASNCAFNLIINTNNSFTVNIKENMITTLGAGLTTRNMNREYSDTVSTTIKQGALAGNGGTALIATYIIDGEVPINTPLNKETGLVLKPNTKYEYAFTNISEGDATVLYTIFIREDV